MPTKYLVDADVFIEAKDIYYRFEFCEMFWSWVLSAHSAGMLFSIQKVKAELVAGGSSDPARAWAHKAPPAFFMADTSDATCMSLYADIIAWCQAQSQYTAAAKTTFADYKRADAFLVAAAQRHGCGIITYESSSPSAKIRVPLPDAALAMNVKTIRLHEVLQKHAHDNFKFKP